MLIGLCTGNAFVAAALLFSYEGRRGVATLCLALAAYAQVYALVLLPAVCQLLYVSSTGKEEKAPAFGPGSYVLSAGAFSCWLGALLWLSYASGQGWDFLRNYRALVTAQDHTPNLGLYWYMFSLVFEPFRDFFSFVFNYHFFAYPFPMLARIPHDPLFVACWCVLCIGIFKSYPSVPETELKP